MNQKIQEHVDALFASAPNQSNILDMKEELLANLNDKFQDLVDSGKSEDQAFVLVVSGIGDIGNLLKDFGEASGYQPLEMLKNQQRRSVFISIGIALYVLSVVPIFLLNGFGYSGNLGVSLMFIICAAATGLVVFGSSMNRSAYNKLDNSFVEEYKEKISTDNDRNRLKSAISSSLWSLVVMLYLTFSFITHWWHISWVIFLIGACIQQLITIHFSRGKLAKNMWHGLLWTTTVIVYILVSFATGGWSWSWMIFLAAIATEQLIRLAILWNRQTLD